jgi:twinfilin-like protein
VTLLKSEACTPSQLASKLPEKSPAYTFYSYPTPAPPPSSAPSVKSPTPSASASARNTFHASEGGARSVATTWVPKNSTEVTGTEGEPTEGEEKKDEPDVAELSIAEPEAIKVEGKGRVLFIYTCPSGSPIKFRMVYSSGVRGIQQDASDKAGIEIAAKVS